MAVYSVGDMVTIYFITNEYSKSKSKFIRAWSDDKELVEFYMELHNCPSFQIKKVVKLYEEMDKILSENLHDEIKISNLLIRDPNDPSKTKIISVPITKTELMLIREEYNTYVSGYINYSLLNGVIPFLKNRYQQAFHDILLSSILDKVIMNKSNRINELIEFDQLMIFYKVSSEDFG